MDAKWVWQTLQLVESVRASVPSPASAKPEVAAWLLRARSVRERSLQDGRVRQDLKDVTPRPDPS